MFFWFVSIFLSFLNLKYIPWGHQGHSSYYSHFTGGKNKGKKISRTIKLFFLVLECRKSVTGLLCTPISQRNVFSLNCDRILNDKSWMCLLSFQFPLFLSATRNTARCQHPMNGLTGNTQARHRAPAQDISKVSLSLWSLPWDQLRFLLRLHCSILLILIPSIPYGFWFQEYSTIISLYLHFVLESAPQTDDIFRGCGGWEEGTSIFKPSTFSLNISDVHENNFLL